MNWHDDRELAQRVAEISSFTFEEALEAIQEGGGERLWMLRTVQHHERSQRRKALIREVRREMHRPRRWLFF